MITKKTEDGGGRFSVINMDNSMVPLIIVSIPLDRGDGPSRNTNVSHASRSEPIDIPYGK